MNGERPHQSPIDAQLSAPPADRLTAKVSQKRSSGSALTESRSMVLLILFGVTGALGIPLLWINKRFSLIEKLFWSAMVLIYTSLLVGFAAWVVMWAYRVVTGG